MKLLKYVCLILSLSFVATTHSETTTTIAQSDKVRVIVGTTSKNISAGNFNTTVTKINNCVSYGADPTGANDSLSAIQAALDQGGNVYLPPGVYKITNGLSIPSNTIFYGAGGGSTIIRPIAGSLPGIDKNGERNYAAILMIGVSNVTVRDLFVDLQTNQTQSNGISAVINVATPCNNILIENNTVTGYDVHQYLIWAYRSNNVSILNNYIDGYVTASPSSEQEGIEMFGGSNCLISGNKITRSGRGINLFTNGTGGDILNCTVTANIITNCVSGINSAADIDSESDVHSIKDWLITSNVIDTMSAYGLAVTVAAGCTVDGLNMNSNIINACQNGIWLFGNSGAVSKKISIANNVIRDSTTSTSASLYCTNLDNLSISGNYIQGVVAGVGLQVNASDNILISGNRVEDVYTVGIIGFANTDVMISGNIVKNWDTSSNWTSAIHMTGDDIFVTNNFINGAVGGQAVVLTDGNRGRILGNTYVGGSNSTPYTNSTTSPILPLNDISQSGGPSIFSTETIKGTTGGFKRQFSEAASSALSGASGSIAVNVPSGSRILGVQLRVDTAITSDSGVSWTAEYVNTPTTAICSGQAFTKQTKVNAIHPAYELTTGTVAITITPNAGVFTAGVIRAIVYYESLTAMSNAL